MPLRFIGHSLSYSEGGERRQLQHGAVGNFPRELVERYPHRFVPVGEEPKAKSSAQTSPGPKPSDGGTPDPDDSGIGEVRRRYKRKK